MQFTTFLLGLLAATTTLAAPWEQTWTDNKLRVTLTGPHVHRSKSAFPPSPATTLQPTSPGPFTTVTLNVGKAAPNQAARCKILNDAGSAIVLQRGANTDITFADGGKGPWTFRDGPQKVSDVICDPTFRKITPSEIQTANEIRVQLSDPGAEFAIQSAFTPGKRQENIVNPGPFSTVEVMVGAFVKKQDYRCAVVGKDGKSIVAKRGKNVDTTFSDAGKGEWTFLQKGEVRSVVCDPGFKAKPQ